MKFSTGVLASVFATTAVAAAFVGYKTLETVFDPHHPNYFGLVILGQTTESHYPKYGGAYPYDEYMRNRFLASPQMAYDDLKRVYGIQFNGDHVKAYSDFVATWGNFKIGVGEFGKVPARRAFPLAPDPSEYNSRSAMLMFLSIKAFNREVYNILDGIKLCNDVSGENVERMKMGIPQVPGCNL